MAEYINREKLLDELGESASYHAESGREYQLLLRDRNIVREQPTADVVERSKYDKLYEEHLKAIHRHTECLKELHELRSKIDNAIEEIEDYNVLNNFAFFKEDFKLGVTRGLDLASEILKRNIGE